MTVSLHEGETRRVAQRYRYRWRLANVGMGVALSQPQGSGNSTTASMMLAQSPSWTPACEIRSVASGGGGGGADMRATLVGVHVVRTNAESNHTFAIQSR